MLTLVLNCNGNAIGLLHVFDHSTVVSIYINCSDDTVCRYSSLK